jgi:hypothetical protein
VNFGQNILHKGSGMLSVGDELVITGLDESLKGDSAAKIL